MSARKGLRSRDVVIILVAAMIFYLVLIGVRGVSLLGDHRWTVKLLGVGVLLLPLVGVAIIVAELRFGRAAERLGGIIGDEPGGPAAGEAEPDPQAGFERSKARAEQEPEDWRSWYWLAVAYGENRDAQRGRRTMRRAIALERQARPRSAPKA